MVGGESWQSMVAEQFVKERNSLEKPLLLLLWQLFQKSLQAKLLILFSISNVFYPPLPIISIAFVCSFAWGGEKKLNWKFGSASESNTSPV